jgi:hypothetical protein
MSRITPGTRWIMVNLAIASVLLALAWAIAGFWTWVFIVYCGWLGGSIVMRGSADRS